MFKLWHEKVLSGIKEPLEFFLYLSLCEIIFSQGEDKPHKKNSDRFIEWVCLSICIQPWTLLQPYSQHWLPKCFPLYQVQWRNPPGVGERRTGHTKELKWWPGQRGWGAGWWPRWAYLSGKAGLLFMCKESKVKQIHCHFLQLHTNRYICNTSNKSMAQSVEP